ncbi:hypothetical protein C6W18_06835 [Bacillus sp. LLTC93]|nr:hypothetical protein C6W18_06835 [Bacillus sp. LLTC93]
MVKEIKRNPVRFFTKDLSYSIIFDNDSQFQLYRNTMEAKIHRLFSTYIKMKKFSYFFNENKENYQNNDFKKKRK